MALTSVETWSRTVDQPFDERLQSIFDLKVNGVYGEAWALTDNTIVIYDVDNPPAWLVPILEARDEDGCTDLA